MKRSCVLLCLSACSTGMSKGGAGGSLVDAEPDDEDAATPTPPARDAAVLVRLRSPLPTSRSRRI
jgi:hypothetical protein